MKKQQNKYSKGFTLLELLVVIIIIGLLAAIIMASVNSARAKGRDTKRITEMKSMVDALAIYYSANGSYPKICSQGVMATTCPELVPFIKTVPEGISYTGLDVAGGPTPTTCKGYHLGITLETNNKVLETDRDFDSRNAGNLDDIGSAYTSRCGNAAGLAIRGTNAGTEISCKAADTYGSYCYDLVQ